MASSSALTLVDAAYRRWVDDRAPRLAAALAYYSVFSFAPMLLIAAGLGSLSFGDPNLQARMVGQMGSLLGPQGTEIVANLMQRNPVSTTSGVFGAVVGFGGLIVAAVGLLAQLKDALNSVWDVDAPEHSTWLDWVRAYVVNVALVIATGFLLLVSLVITALVSGLTDRMHRWLAGPAFLWFGVDFIAGLTVAAIVFALIYRVVPDTHVGWSEAWMGGLFTGVLFTVGRLALGWYLGRKAGDSISDAAGSVLALMVWVYYSAQLVLFGAEFTVAFANRDQPAAATAHPQARPQAAQAGGPGSSLV